MIHGERLALDAEERLDRADKRLAELEPDAAEPLIDKAQDLLAHPDVGYYPERHMLNQRLLGARTRLPAARAEKKKRDLQKLVDEQKREVELALAELERAMSELNPSVPVREHVKGARKAMESLAEKIGDGRELEPQDAPYAAFAASARKRHDAAEPKVKHAAALATFLSGPCVSRSEGRESVAKARMAAGLEDRIDAWEDAQKKLVACTQDAQNQIALGGVGGQALVVAGAMTTPAAVLASCAKESGAVAAALEKDRKALAAKKAREEVLRKQREAAEERKAAAQARAKKKKK
ncbi:MAG: hypothetical protein HY901_32325 [Deltaproteobacteria bacterium]|nr:hypothetical protein [Deltaproteobacteria bacterium]